MSGFDRARLKWGEPQASTGRSRSARAKAETAGGPEREGASTPHISRQATLVRAAWRCSCAAWPSLPATAVLAARHRSGAPRPPGCRLGLAPLQSRLLDDRHPSQLQRRRSSSSELPRRLRHAFPFTRSATAQWPLGARFTSVALKRESVSRPADCAASRDCRLGWTSAVSGFDRARLKWGEPQVSTGRSRSARTKAETAGGHEWEDGGGD